MSNWLLATSIANDITATLSARGIPVHRPLHHKRSVTRLHRQRDFIPIVPISGMVQVPDHDGRHVHGVATVPHHLLPAGVDGAHRTGGAYADGLAVGRGVLDGQPLIITQVAVALGEA